MEENRKDEITESNDATLNLDAEKEVAGENLSEKKQSVVVRFFATLLNYVKRAFFGASNTLYKEIKEREEKEKDDVFAVEKIESPGKQRVKAFMQKKLAVGAALVFVSLNAV